ncbi:hypothetical protein BDR22DRAFT_894424 [Usnea florida]
MSAVAPTSASDYQLLHIHNSRVPELIVSMAVCLPAAYIAIFLRFLSRRIGKVPLKADDWWLVVGLLFTTVYITCEAILTHLGLGRHAILLKKPTTFAKVIVAKEVLYNPAIVAIKTSILLLYRRLFTARCANTSFAISLWCTGAFVLSYSIGQAVLTDPTVNAKCINFHDVLIIFSSLNIGTDILILCLPVPQLWRLNMPRRRKYELMGIFLLGGFFCVASVIRVPYIARMSLLDPSWSDVYGAIWSIVELNLGILSACLPTLRPLFLHVFRGGYSSTSHCQPAKRKSTGNVESDTIPMVEIEAAFIA